MQHTTVRIVGHGEDYPYALEVTTPGWRGVDAAFEGPMKFPDDLMTICTVLKDAGADYYSVSEPTQKGVLMFMADGTTEFVFQDLTNFENAVMALTKAGWLWPEAESSSIH